jgi:hypothetical protein
VAATADIDRLIEDGLNRYGSGDLDGALLVWEEALAIDPDNAQANSYVDYVRMNYEVLQTDSGFGVASDDGVPFGIEDEPEYIIEITQGHEIPAGEPAPAPMFMDPLDQGWFIEEDPNDVTVARTRSKNPPVSRAPSRESIREIVLEADEPPEIELSPTPPISAPEISFDSATREYGTDDQGLSRRTSAEGQRDVVDDQDTPRPRSGTNELFEDSGSFKSESTPLGFGNLETEVKKRDLGFVQPAQGPAHLEVRLRTPSSPPANKPPVAEDNLHPQTIRGMPAIVIPATTTEDDLINSLPQPTRPRSTEPGAPVSGLARTVTPVRGSVTPGEERRIPTRDLPEKKRKPASLTDRAVTLQGEDGDIALPSAATRELVPTNPISPIVMPTITGAPAIDEFSISAPTRELGLRPGGRPPSHLGDEDLPTRQTDVQKLRDEHATQKLKVEDRDKDIGDSTNTDLVLRFDPIDARSAQILDEIETPGSEPPNEAKDDRTRRRITALIERALMWSAAGELDKAVAAVDLALSEDPNSALAQKLIHRNREAIMTTFQAYMGDLERQPQLARPLHELASAPISPRAAFLLSRIDGMLTIDEILDVSGMPRLEAYRHLCQLFLRGILR